MEIPEGFTRLISTLTNMNTIESPLESDLSIATHLLMNMAEFIQKISKLPAFKEIHIDRGMGAMNILEFKVDENVVEANYLLNKFKEWK